MPDIRRLSHNTATYKTQKATKYFIARIRYLISNMLYLPPRPCRLSCRSCRGTHFSTFFPVAVRRIGTLHIGRRIPVRPSDLIRRAPKRSRITSATRVMSHAGVEVAPQIPTLEQFPNTRRAVRSPPRYCKHGCWRGGIRRTAPCRCSTSCRRRRSPHQTARQGCEGCARGSRRGGQIVSSTVSMRSSPRRSRIFSASRQKRSTLCVV